MKNYLLGACLAFFACFQHCTTEDVTLEPNILDDLDFEPFTFDSVVLEPQSGISYKTFKVYFTPQLDKLTPEQRARVKAFYWKQNGIERQALPLDRRWIGLNSIPAGNQFTWEFGFQVSQGTVSRLSTFEYKVP